MAPCVLPALRYGLPIATVLVVTWWAYGVVYDRGVAACDLRHQAAATDAAQQAAKAAEEVHRQFVASVEWSGKLATRLAAANRQIDDTRRKHEDAARRLAGHCPDTLRVLHDAAASGADVLEAGGQSPGPAKTVAASAIGEAVAGNYAECRGYIRQLDTLIDWHERNGQPELRSKP